MENGRIEPLRALRTSGGNPLMGISLLPGGSGPLHPAQAPGDSWKMEGRGGLWRPLEASGGPWEAACGAPASCFVFL